MITITKELAFDYGHKLLGHEGKCRNVHGHRGRVLVEVTAPNLDTLGRVIDFSVLKETLGGWLDGNIDHVFIAQAADPLAGVLVGSTPGLPLRLGLHGNDPENTMSSRVYVTEAPPTVENLARHLGLVFTQLLEPTPLQVVSLTFFETPTSSARWTP